MILKSRIVLFFHIVTSALPRIKYVLIDLERAQFHILFGS